MPPHDIADSKMTDLVFRASPMTYMVGGKQYVSIAGPAGFLTFGLP
jgi:hypothetical protein